MAHDVFVSYSSKDKPVADAVVAGLENKGIRCWVAPRDIAPGSSWGDAIITAIEGSRFMVIILSGNSNLSSQVVREVERAVASDVILIPFRIENIDLTGAMAHFLTKEHWLDAFPPPLESHLPCLVGYVQRMLSKNEASHPTSQVVLPTCPIRDFSLVEREAEIVQLQGNNTKIHEESMQAENEDSPWKLFISNFPIQSSNISRIQDRQETLQQLYKAIALSADTLLSNPRELPSQLSGRLASSTNAGIIDFLLSLNIKVQYTWLRPRSLCLPGPDSPILASWSILDEVPACRLLVSDNSNVVSVVTRDTRWFWDLNTGLPLSVLEAYPLFSNVDWTLWKANLPDRQFTNSIIHTEWLATTPPGPLTVSCLLKRWGGSFDISYENTVTSDNLGDEREHSKTWTSEVFASKGFLAPSISGASNKIICGGLGGEISIWDLGSGSLDFNIKIGNRTIVAIAGFPDLKRCAALTLDGQLLIVETTVKTDRSETHTAPPMDLYLSKDHPIAVVTHMNGSVSVWSTQTGYSKILRPGWSLGSPMANFRLTPDLSVAIITGHGQDTYAGWLLNVVNLVTGEELFAVETERSSEVFGALVLEKRDNGLYLRIDPLDLKKRGTLSSYTDDAIWVPLTTQKLCISEPPPKKGNIIEWARPSFTNGTGKDLVYAPWFTDKTIDRNTGSERIILSNDLRTILAFNSETPLAQFTMDESIYLLGISPYDNAVVFVTRAELYVLDLIENE